MAIDTIAALGLLSDLFIAIAESVRKVKKTPKQEFAREMLALFDIFDEVEKDTTIIIDNLKRFENESTIGLRVQFIHKAGVHLSNLENTLKQFINWIAFHGRWSATLGVFSPDAKKALRRVEDIETAMFRSTHYYTQALDKLRLELQAVKSPEPENFPQPAYVNRVVKQMEILRTDTQHTKELIREFASSHLTIEDIFS